MLNMRKINKGFIMKKLFCYNEFVEVLDKNNENEIVKKMFSVLDKNNEKNFIVLSHPKLGFFFAHFTDIREITRPKTYFEKFKCYMELYNYEQNIRNERNARQRLKVTTGRTHDYILIGGVHRHANDFVNVLNDMRRRDIWSSLKPRTIDKYIGVELELCSTLKERTFVELLRKTPLRRYVSLCEDCSIEPDNYNNDCDCCYDEDNECHEDCCSSLESDFGIEMRLLMKENEIKDVMGLLNDFLKQTNAYVNDSCGLHVHLDMRLRDVHDCYLKLFNNLDNITKMVDRSRLDNRFCRKNKRDNFDEQSSLEDRYYMINTQSYNEHTTLEIRVHEATTNTQKIESWIKFLIETIDKPLNQQVKREEIA